MLYRLSGIENDSDEDGEQDVALPDFDARPNNESLFSDWQSPFNISEFQPNQFFPNWDDPSPTTNNHERLEVTSNGHDHGTTSKY